MMRFLAASLAKVACLSASMACLCFSSAALLASSAFTFFRLSCAESTPFTGRLDFGGRGRNASCCFCFSRKAARSCSFCSLAALFSCIRRNRLVATSIRLSLSTCAASFSLRSLSCSASMRSASSLCFFFSSIKRCFDLSLKSDGCCSNGSATCCNASRTSSCSWTSDVRGFAGGSGPSKKAASESSNPTGSDSSSSASGLELSPLFSEILHAMPCCCCKGLEREP
mmetsp:Transcript_23961/g.55318  ORF Transcript_23961/g.55318 Transcript_23961/m.55318 type:complete len:226 (+) Transcript_23961:1086-1763(+)